MLQGSSDCYPSSDAGEILQLTQEAFDLATAACHFDRQENYVGAYDYYDKCILNIDEVMSKLPRTSVQWMELMQIRIRYDDRMEQIKEMENLYSQKNSFFHRGSNSAPPNDANSTAVVGELNDDSSATPGAGLSSKSWKNRARYRLKQQMDVYNFSDMDIDHDYTFSTPPNSPIAVIFWQLKNIQQTIEQGGYLSKEIFIPKNVWTQGEVKFSGVSNKMHTFEAILKLIATHIDTLYLYSDQDSLQLADRAFSCVLEDLLALQNQLSKSFGYIREIPASFLGNYSKYLAGGASVTEEELFAFFSSGGSGSEAGSQDASGSNTPPVPANPATAAATSAAPQPAPSNSSPATSSSTASGKQGNKTLSQYMSALGKNMKKYAEVGLHRLAVALPTKLSPEEFAQYTQLIAQVCEKVQVFLLWYQFLEGLKSGSDAHLTENPIFQNPDRKKDQVPLAYQGPRTSFSITVTTSNSDPDTPSTSAATAAQEAVKTSVATTQEDTLLSLSQLQIIDKMVCTLSLISFLVKETVGEIVLRDIEYLLDRYLNGMRKSYSRMYWDQEYTE